MEKSHLSVEEAAEFLSCAKSTIYQHIHDNSALGRLFTHKGPKILVSRAKLEAYLEEE